MGQGQSAYPMEPVAVLIVEFESGWLTAGVPTGV